MPSTPISADYYLTIYDGAGKRIFECWAGYSCGTSGASVAVTPSINSTQTYAAYVSKDHPASAPPVADVRASAAAQVANVGWIGELAVKVDKSTVDANNPAAKLTVTPTSRVPSPFYLTVYDNTGHLWLDCSNPYSPSSCTSGATIDVSVPNNADRTFTAYVSLDHPAAGSAVSDVRATASAQVSNIGWTGQIGVSIDRQTLDANNPTAKLTLKPTVKVVAPYYLTVYDEAGSRVFDCYSSYYSNSCNSGITIDARVPNNGTKVFTAYVAQDRPTAGPPVVDVRSSSSVTLSNIGWTGVVTLTADRTLVDATNSKVTLRAVPSVYVPDPYFLTVYDDQGKKLVDCAGYSSCSSGKSVDVYAPNASTHKYSAYVALDHPDSGHPVNDVKSTSSVAVANQGWIGSVGLIAEATSVVAGDPFARLTVRPSSAIPLPYYMTIYDNTGEKVYECGAMYSCARGAGSAVAQVPNNESRTYTAYISEDHPNVGPPTVGVRSTASVSVENLGWLGSVGLSVARTERRTSTYSIYLDVTTDPEVAIGYFWSLYDQDGKLLDSCVGGSVCADGTLYYDAAFIGETPVYTAYVAQDRPKNGPPVVDVRAISGLMATTSSGPTEPGEVSGGSNPSEQCTQGCAGDPVNTATGEFWENTADLQIAGLGAGVSFSRTYGSSMAGTSGPLGYGWAVASEMSMSIPIGATGTTLADASKIQIRQENGSVITFGRTGAGSYVAPARVFATLERQSDGTFVLTRRGTQSFVFDSSGSLVSERDRNGNAISYARTSGRLTKISDQSGHYIDVGWSGDRISSLADSSDRTVSYDYSAAGDLVRVTAVDGSSQSFGYDSSHRITSMTSASGGSTSNVYDQSSRVISQTDPLGRVTRFAYGSGATTVTDPAGSVSVHRYVDGQMMSVTRASGTPLAETTYYTYTTSNEVQSVTDPLGRVTKYSYDSRGNRTSVVDPAGHATTVSYDGWGNPLAITNAMGKVSRFVYDSRGNLVSGVGPDGAVTSLTINSDGTVASTADPLGRVTSYVYDTAGHPVSVTGPDGAVAASQFDALGRVVSSTDPVGGTSSFEYDAAGRVVSSTDATGAVSTVAYDAAGRVVRVTDPLGRVTESTYDAAGQVVAVRSPAGEVTRYTYDLGGRVATVTDPTGAVTTNTYDVLGQLVAVTDPLGRVTHREYDAAGRLTAVVDPAGGRTVYGYGVGDKVTKVTDPAGAVTTMTYDALDRLLTTTDPTGARTSRTYDLAGRVATVTDAAGRVSSQEFDSAGELTATVDPAGARTTYAFDAAGRVVGVTDPLGGVSTTGYDKAGRALWATDADGRRVVTAYDAAGRPVAVTRADGSTIAWAYDAAGQQTSYTDAAGAVTDYEYNVDGRVTSRTDQAGAVTGYAYDAAGRPTVTTSPSGSTTTQLWDAAGQLVGIDYSGPTADVAYTYDAAGRRTTMVDGTGTTEYTYDAAGRYTQVASPVGTVGYQWDAAGRLATLTYPGDRDVVYGYSAAGELNTVTDWTGGVYSLGYDARGTVASLGYPNGVTTGYNHDAAGQTVGILTQDTPGAELLALGYSYSDAGLLTSADTAWTVGSRAPPTAGATASQYGWDAQARLDEVSGDNAGEVSFTPADQVATVDTGTALTWNTNGQLTSTTAANGTLTQFGYDANGNRTTASATDPATPTQTATTTYAWNTAGKLTSLTSPTGQASTYTYNGDGLRLTATSGDQATTNFVWDTATAIPRVLTADGQGYIYAGGSTPIAQITLTTGTAEYLHTDLTGSVRAVTDSTGTLVARTDYSTYGTLQGVTATDGSTLPAVATLTSFGYAGEYTDPTGLIYLRARWYDPNTASFLSIDPLVDHTRNAYGYTGGNPLQYGDPLGLSWLDNLSDGVAAFGDAVTFGGTSAIRQLINYELNGEFDDLADHCSTSYSVGAFTGEIAVDIATSGLGGGAKATAAVAKEALERSAAEASKAAAKSAAKRSAIKAAAKREAEEAAERSAADAAAETNKIYSARVLNRAAEEAGPFHNFPESFDDLILSGGTRTVNPNYFTRPKPNLGSDSIQYRLPGEINGRGGVYEIFTRPSVSGRTELVTHRFFRPDHP